MKLTAEQKQTYFERGWLEIPNLFSADEIKRASESFDALLAKAQKLRTTQVFESAFYVLDERDRDIIIKRIVWAGGSEPYLLKLGQDPRLTRLASLLLN